MFGLKKLGGDLQMSSDTAISLRKVNKCYRMYNNPQDRLKQGLFRGKKQYYQEYRALDGISFDINKGQTIGIIGSNGSGKSTILQIIAGTIKPTSGDVYVNGRVAAILELGSGFNPDFTGRENAIMNATIMGLPNSKIREKLHLIEEFADIGDFIDRPVKVYSSGMYVRLAFACAINVEPDILIVDEALAVGDMHFQLKCIEKMKRFKQEGKTILFVSHDPYQVRNFCDQAIWVMDGKIHKRGEVNSVTREYEDYMKLDKGFAAESLDINQVSSDVVSIDNVTFMDEKQEPRLDYNFGEQINVEVGYTIHTEIEGLVGGVALFDKINTCICGLNTKLDDYKLPYKPGKYKLRISYDEMSLLPGVYYVDVGFFESSGLVRLDYKAKINKFRINSGRYFAEGLTLIKHYWESEGDKV